MLLLGGILTMLFFGKYQESFQTCTDTRVIFLLTKAWDTEYSDILTEHAPGTEAQLAPN